jgi:hypothetical protein
LGRKIVDELGLDRSVDTLGRWMAHYIAELIQSAEATEGADRSEKLSRCANAILDLWKHRHVLPNGKRPFEEFEPILQTLETLDPNSDTPRYFRSARTAAAENDCDTETRQWLDLADRIDYSARILIRYCLGCAVDKAASRLNEWIELADEFASDEEIDVLLVRIINGEHELLNSPLPNELARKEIEDRIGRLEAFLLAVNALSSELHARLEELKEDSGS